MQGFQYSDFLLYYLLPPFLSMALGGIVGQFLRLSENVRAGVLHFVAGIISLAIAAELLPKMLASKSVFEVTTGFVLGFLLMMFLKYVVGALNKKKKQEGDVLVTIVALSLHSVMDGLLVTVSFMAGAKAGFMVTTAVTIARFFLGLTTVSMLVGGQYSRSKASFATTTISFMTLIGGSITYFAFTSMASVDLGPEIAFGVAALMFFLIEELLTAAHAVKENAWMTSLFFLGYLLYIIFDMLYGVAG